MKLFNFNNNKIKNMDTAIFSEFIKKHYNFFFELIVCFFSICLLIIIIVFYSNEICFLNILFIKLTILILLFCTLFNIYLKIKEYKKISKDTSFISRNFLYIYGSIFIVTIIFIGIVIKYLILHYSINYIV